MQISGQAWRRTRPPEGTWARARLSSPVIDEPREPRTAACLQRGPCPDTPPNADPLVHMGLWGAGDVSAIDRFVASGAATEMTGLHGSSVDVLREDSSAMSLHSTT